ncbi:hypothetical protein ACFL6U_16210 [Planctomycetota bacterium]
MCQIRRKQSGMTLVEVVVASGLLIAGIVPILRAMTTSHVTLRHVEQHSRSLSLAQAELASLQARARIQYSQDLGQSNVDWGNGYRGIVTDDRHATLRTVSVSAGFDDNDDGRLSGGERDVQLTTYIALLDE